MLIKAIWQTAGIIVLACILAASVNLLRGSAVPFVGDWSADSRFADDPGQNLVISLKEASRLYAENKAVFVDARPEHQYDQGRIKGAVSLPWQDADDRFLEVTDRLEGKETIITYCDGENCELSHELALFLSDMGFEDVRVLINGWTKWRQAGLPTQTGDQGNE
ncbi:MAG: rhodanese-like domain-containing protein [Desulfobacterales bacterium]